MKKCVTRSLAFGVVIAALSLSLSADQNAASTVQFLSVSDLNKASSHSPASTHRHVRQPLEYGKGSRYGHSVNGALGDITIWSPATNKSHGSMLKAQPSRTQSPRTSNINGSQLEYKPEYGKATKPGYGG